MRIFSGLVVFFLTVAAGAEPQCHLAPELRQFLDVVEKKGNALDRLSPDTLGDLRKKREDDALKKIIPFTGVSDQDLKIPSRGHEIAIRVYTPIQIQKGSQNKLPVLFFIHGGGWTLGSIGTYDNITRALAQLIPAVVISVNYQLAPEHPFPAALDDVTETLSWVSQNVKNFGGDKTRIGVAGDSGGGTLAAVLARKSKIKIAYEALFYPSTDIERTDTESENQFGKGYLLTLKSIVDFRHFYLPHPSDWQNPDASPLLASDSELARLPPTLVIPAGCDPLRDEGIAYAEKLKKNGVKVTLNIKDSMIHGFLGFYNNAATPGLSKLVEPILKEAAESIHQGLAP